jgi:hypothetical protein
MEAEIAAEQGRKREAALHAALQAEKRFKRYVRRFDWVLARSSAWSWFGRRTNAMIKKCADLASFYLLAGGVFLIASLGKACRSRLLQPPLLVMRQ